MTWFLIFWFFFEYMQVWWLFTIKTFDFFEYMQVLRTFGIKMLLFLSICRFGEPQVFQTYIFATKKQKRRIDRLNLFFLFSNFPDEKEIHNIFKYNEHFSTTWPMSIDTFERGISIKYCLTAIAKHIVETQTLHWKRLRTSLDM